ncbi:MAG: hypothetical protein OXE59_02730 [Bacteroidetes bacterium]|nr:hypothetical protein [Bacteroidota bacterium]MCY4232644.1 hypothetical protein [Bacteroidota bacterium]
MTLDESWNNDLEEFDRPVGVDEAYLGRLEKSKHEDIKLNACLSFVGKVTMVVANDRTTIKYRHG